MTVRLVHLGTTVQTVFGVLDEDDNVIPQEPLTVEIRAFSRDAFVSAFDAIHQARDEAVVRTEAARAEDDTPARSNLVSESGSVLQRTGTPPPVAP